MSYGFVGVKGGGEWHPVIVWIFYLFFELFDLSGVEVVVLVTMCCEELILFL